jgi:hypothetical protein
MFSIPGSADETTMKGQVSFTAQQISQTNIIVNGVV